MASGLIYDENGRDITMSIADAIAAEGHRNEGPRFYITFSAPGLRDGWVELVTDDEDRARTYAREFYGKVWSGIYDDTDWDPKYFPRGKFGEVPLP
jgi:hypothetical protein